ncbi:cytochrome P450 4F4-like [Mytilus edulis]|uniref:cytochrome P450 4F4-like n=1 Tax=Mytilus edulis TaxID=6550 RepID=UPI0039EDE924
MALVPVESLGSPFLALFGVIVLSYLVISVIRFRKKRQFYDNLPGPDDFNWLHGNLHTYPIDSEERLRRHYENICKWPKLHRIWAGGFLPHVLLYHPDTIKVILKTSEPKPRGLGGVYEYAIPWLGEGLLISDGDRWARSRRLLTPAFHFEILKPYVKVYNDCADILVNKISKCAESGASFEAFENVSLCTLDIILRCAFSYENDCQTRGESHPYVKAVNELAQLWLERARSPWLHFDSVYYLTTNGRTFKKHCDYVHKVTEDIIDSRKNVLKKEQSMNIDRKRYLDFLDILLSAKDEEGVGLTPLEIRNEADTFLFEGHDTTSSGISWALYSLAEHQEYQKLAQNEIDSIMKDKDTDSFEWDDLSKMDYLGRCIKEALRLHSPVPFIMRKITKDVEIDGTTFPAGCRFTLHLYNLHHNPHVWEDPMEFNPDRFLPENLKNKDSFAFTPFSAGPRNCIGQHFAMNEEKVVIANILRKFHLSLDPNHKVMKKISAVMRSENGIRLIATPRNIA